MEKGEMMAIANRLGVLRLFIRLASAVAGRESDVQIRKMFTADRIRDNELAGRVYPFVKRIELARCKSRRRVWASSDASRGLNSSVHGERHAILDYYQQEYYKIPQSK